MLKNKRILITAGPTWEKIDPVRVISNTATGETGFVLAGMARKYGAKPTVLMGPAPCGKADSRIKIKYFKYFDELKSLIKKELKSKKYSILIHCAAVSDYKIKAASKGKISSGLKNLKLDLLPNKKIIDSIKKIDKDIFLVGFKYEPLSGRSKLIAKAKKLISSSEADIVIANTRKTGGYCAYIVGKNEICGPFYSKTSMAAQLFRKIGESLCRI